MNVTETHEQPVIALRSSDLLGDWSQSMPTIAGVYEIRCFETGRKPERVSVYRKRINGEESLWVSDNRGLNPLNHYHENLIDIEWRKVV